jgi:hypothetical protein
VDIGYAQVNGHSDGSQLIRSSARLARISAASPRAGELVHRLVDIGIAALPRARHDGGFVFRLDAARDPGGVWRLSPSGTSQRYATIAALGLLRLPVAAQREVLGGITGKDLVDALVGRLDRQTSLGDVALVCWAAAESEHAALPHALSRLAQIDRQAGQTHVVDAAWVVCALVAAREHADVEEHLASARRRLLAARGPAAYPHLTGSGSAWHRAHVGSFADQVYPVQALARLHRSADDPEALAVADSVASVICAAQGDEGQWWWHYDARTGRVVEGYPVYSVHQHAMAPMALLDLAEAGGSNYVDALCRGLLWLADPAETAEALVLDEPPLIWRKVARADRRKLVRGLRAASTRIRPGLRLGLLDRMFPPGSVDHEWRPYELGWLLMAWLS